MVRLIDVWPGCCSVFLIALLMGAIWVVVLKPAVELGVITLVDALVPLGFNHLSTVKSKRVCQPGWSGLMCDVPMVTSEENEMEQLRARVTKALGCPEGADLINGNWQCHDGLTTDKRSWSYYRGVDASDRLKCSGWMSGQANYINGKWECR